MLEIIITSFLCFACQHIVNLISLCHHKFFWLYFQSNCYLVFKYLFGTLGGKYAVLYAAFNNIETAS